MITSMVRACRLFGVLLLLALVVHASCTAPPPAEPTPGGTTEPPPSGTTEPPPGGTTEPPPSAPVNQLPEANAGSDQTVQGNSTVQLDGSASSDPDGDPVTFTWSQLSGPTVSLTGADTATPSFIAPNTNTTLTFALAVSDGNGGADVDTVDVVVSEQSRPAQLFVVSFGGSVISFLNPACIEGDVAPNTVLEGALTQLKFSTGVVVNGAGELLVTQDAGEPLTVYADAAGVTGDVAPVRAVQGPATMLSSPRPMAIKSGDDLLFVGDIATDEIHVFDNVSTSSFDGDLAPIRKFGTNGTLGNPWALDFDAGDNLYVVNRGSDNVLVYAGASGLDGDVAPSRTINSASFAALRGLYVDDDDTLYVVSSNNGEVFVFDHASSLDGTVTPDRTITVAGTGTLWAIIVDKAGTGYILSNGNAVHVYENIVSLEGTVVPDRTIEGPSTQLSDPRRIFLVEAIGNQPPVAKAGADQTVSGGATVQLDGSASCDPNSDTLNFTWIQTGGTSVSLTGAGTATPSFEAPDEDVTLSFQLTAIDSKGGSDTDSVSVAVSKVTSQLFIVNFGGRVISYHNPSIVDGDAAPATVLEGALTDLSLSTGVVVNAAGELIVCQGGAIILAFADAATATGDIAPARKIEGANTLLDFPRPMAIKQAEDLLFVGDISTDKIHVFANVSTAAFDGNVAPARVFGTAGTLENPWALDFDEGDNLYVVNRGNDTVPVYEGASSLDGNVAPTRTIDSASFSALRGVFVDGNDRLYVVDSTNDEVYVFDNAASLDGAVNPDRTLTVSGAGDLWAIVVAADGTGFILDNGGAVFTYDNIGTLDGTVTPTHTIQGANTQMSDPRRMFLQE